MKTICAVLMMTLVLASCTSTYDQNPITTPATRLVAGKSVLIATPPNATYGSTSYSQSGKMTAAAVRSAFVRYSDQVTVVDTCTDIDCLLGDPSPSHYFVVPEILHWEDRATEWSGKKDKVEIKITVYSSTRDVLASNVITGKSKWASFGGDHPQDLLPEPVKTYIDSLFE